MAHGHRHTGFVPSGLPNYKSKESWFAWPVYRRAPAAATAAAEVETPVDEAQEGPPPTAVTSQVQAGPPPAATPQAQAVPQASPAFAIDDDAIGRRIADLAIAKFKQNMSSAGRRSG